MQSKPVGEENKFLLLGFWEFAVLSTLVIVLFPWSLLYFLVFHGLDETLMLLAALAHDFIKTVLTVLALVAILAIFGIGLLVIFSK